jgi:hypothetical protein
VEADSVLRRRPIWLFCRNVVHGVSSLVHREQAGVGVGLLPPKMHFSFKV